MSKLQNYRRLLSNRNYFLLWLGHTTSEFGSAISRIALVLLVYKFSEQVTAVAGLMIVQTLPVIFLGTFTGALLESLNRKRVMLAMDIGRGVLIILIPFCSELWQIYLISFFISLGNIFFLPARDAIIPDLVQKEQLSSANSLIATMLGASMVIGPAIGGALVGFYDFRLAFFIDAFTFFASAAAIYFIHYLPRRKTGLANSPQAILANIREGFLFIKSNLPLRVLMHLVFWASLAAGFLFPLLPEFNENFLHGNDFTFGLLSSMYGLGGLLGGPVGDWISRRFNKGSILYWILIIDSFLFVLFSAIPNLYASLAVVAIWGIIGFAWWVVYMTLMQEVIPETHRGRTFTALHQLENAGMVIAFGAAGMLGGLAPAQVIFMGAGFLYLITLSILRWHRGFKAFIQMK